MWHADTRLDRQTDRQREKRTRHANMWVQRIRDHKSYKIEADNAECPSLKNQNFLFLFNTITDTSAYIMNGNNSNGSTRD